MHSGLFVTMDLESGETQGSMEVMWLKCQHHLFISVLKGTDLPGLDSSGLSDPYVEMSLQPHVLFETTKMQKTSVIKNTLNPTFNTVFQL